MGKTRIGSNTATYKVGTRDVSKIYLGSVLVYPEVTPTTKRYLEFRTTESGTFKFTNPIQYSTDSGSTWVELAANTDTPTFSSGSNIIWKATLTPQSGTGVGTFSSTGKFNVNGNPMSLLYGDDFEDKTDLTSKDYAFESLFNDCSGLVNAENLSLPATTLAEYCYDGMFKGCTSLTTAPELPATDVKKFCYCEMFYGCSSLTTAPDLPTSFLEEGCYQKMFYQCSSLTEAPMLSARSLAPYCYYGMFASCGALETAPELPSKELQEYCYGNMFDACTLLHESPVLPATTLVTNCYNSMFQNCFSLRKITCLALNPGTQYTSGWVSGVPYGESVGGVFIKNPSENNWQQCQQGSDSSGIPCGWDVQDYIIE